MDGSSGAPALGPLGDFLLAFAACFDRREAAWVIVDAWRRALLPRPPPLAGLLSGGGLVRAAALAAGARLIVAALRDAPLDLVLSNTGCWVFGDGASGGGAPPPPPLLGLRLAELPPDFGAAAAALVATPTAWRTPPLLFPSRYDAHGFGSNDALEGRFPRRVLLGLLVLRTPTLAAVWRDALGAADPLSDVMLLLAQRVQRARGGDADGSALSVEALLAEAVAPRPRRPPRFSAFHHGPPPPPPPPPRASPPGRLWPWDDTHAEELLADGRFPAALAAARAAGRQPWEVLRDVLAMPPPPRARRRACTAVLQYVARTPPAAGTLWVLPHALFAGVALLRCDAGGCMPGVTTPAYLYPLALALVRARHPAADRAVAAWRRAGTGARDPRPRARATVHINAVSERALAEAAAAEGGGAPTRGLVTPHPVRETPLHTFIVGYDASGGPVLLSDAPVAVALTCTARCAQRGLAEACLFAAAAAAGW